MKPFHELYEDVKAGIRALQAFDNPETPEAKREISRLLYDPDARLTKWVYELENYNHQKSPSKMEQQRAARVLEGIALASFARVVGKISIKSYRSPDAQHDLLITGNGGSWKGFCVHCRIDDKKRGVLVEAKSHRTRVSSSQFSRVCSNIDHTTLKGLVSLGIIFSLRGATGFPAGTSDKREIALRDSRLRQAVFFLITEVPIIVFDLEDLKQLSQPGGLPDLIELKVRELFMQCGQVSSRATGASLTEIDAPDYLAEFKPL
jgi:hypothetical protein